MAAAAAVDGRLVDVRELYASGDEPESSDATAVCIMMTGAELHV